MTKLRNLIGHKYGRLTVISFSHRSGVYNYWNVICDCGTLIKATTASMRSGHTKSCGCLNIETLAIIHNPYRKSRISRIWNSMKQRCSNPNVKQWMDYGGRGIKVCDEWRNDFMAFYRWCVENGLDENSRLQIDRIDNDGNYEPSNCRGVTARINNQNRRNNKLTALRAKHIRMLYFFSKRTQQNIANLYGVSEQVISGVVRNKIWLTDEGQN